LPLQLSKGDRKLMQIAGALFFLMVLVAILFAKPRSSESPTATTYSTASSGAKAGYLLLKDSGYDVQRWEQSPAELPNAHGRTLILAEPTGLPTTEERSSLRAFVASGGRIIASGPQVGFYLPSDGIVATPLVSSSWKKISARSPSSITRAAPEITLSPKARWVSEPFAVPLYGDGEDDMVVTYKYGQGEVIWMASATPLTNAGLKTAGNLEFFLACLGPKNQKILWDEYFHGYRSSLSSSVSRTPVKWMFVQLALFGLVIVLTYSRRSAAICVPPREVRLSPLEFVRTLGTLYEQAAAASVAVDIYYHRFRYWLTRRLGLSATVPVQDLEKAIRERWNVKDPDLNATLHACESAQYHSGMPPAEALKLFQTLYDYSARFELFSVRNKEKHELKEKP
jgi:hypothetical protein